MSIENYQAKYQKLLNEALKNWDEAKEDGNEISAEYWSGCVSTYRKIISDLEVMYNEF